MYLNSALKTDGVWNSSNWSSSTFDAAFADYQTAIDVDAQTTATTTMVQTLWEEVPAIYPYFYNYLSGHSDNVSGVEVTALGHIFAGKATKS